MYYININDNYFVYCMLSITRNIIFQEGVKLLICRIKKFIQQKCGYYGKNKIKSYSNKMS